MTLYICILHLVYRSVRIIIVGLPHINYMEYFCTFVVRRDVHVVETCMCCEFALSAVRAYLCSVGRGWVGIVVVNLG